MYAPPVLNRYQRLSLLKDSLFDKPEDPNRPVMLCRSCAVDHHEYWDEMWDHVYGNY